MNEKGKKKNKITKGFVVGTTVLGILGGIALDNWRNREPGIEKYIPVEVNEKVLQVPDYDLKGAFCAQYVRMTAEKVFGLKYTPCDAWDYIKNSRVVKRIDSFDDLEKLAENDILKPGMIIGLYSPDSIYNKEGREFTHVGLNLGGGKIAHFYEDSLVEDFEEIEDRGYIPRAVIAPKK